MRRSLLVLPLLLTLTLAACGDDDEVTTATTTTSPTTEAPTTTVAPTTTAGFDRTTAVWPGPGEPGKATPAEAAVGFGRDYLGMYKPEVVGEFRQGDLRSGEIDIEVEGNGPTTTVLVRQLDGTRWWVIGAGAELIQVDEPTGLQTITSPVHVAGRSTAFEAQVGVHVRQDGDAEPIGTGFVMGGSMGDLAPFAGDITFATPTEEYGEVVLFEGDASGRGEVTSASVIRVRFG